MEEGHGVHRFQSRKDEGPISLRDNRPARALQSLHGRVGVYGHDQGIPHRPGQVEVLHVTSVEDVETTVGEHQPVLPGSAEAMKKCFPGKDFLRWRLEFAHHDGLVACPLGQPLRLLPWGRCALEEVEEEVCAQEDGHPKNHVTGWIVFGEPFVGSEDSRDPSERRPDSPEGDAAEGLIQ